MADAQSRMDTAEFADAEPRRALAARAVAQLIACGQIDEADRTAAHEIIDALSCDAEIRIRQLLAESIADYDRLPLVIAERLARDVEIVAVPILRQSPVLGDAFLISLIEQHEVNEAMQIAIADRAFVSPALGHALVETENAQVVGVLLENSGAEIAPITLDRAVANHKDKPQILRLIAERPEATPEIAAACRSLTLDDSLDRVAAATLVDELTARHDLPAMVAAELMEGALERALVARIAGARDKAEQITFVHSLKEQGRLTETLLFRLLQAGNLNFPTAALSLLARTAPAKVEQIIAAGDFETFGDLYEKTRLEPYMRRAIAIAAFALAGRLAAGQPLDESYDAEIADQVVTFSHRERPAR